MSSPQSRPSLPTKPSGSFHRTALAVSAANRLNRLSSSSSRPEGGPAESFTSSVLESGSRSASPLNQRAPKPHPKYHWLNDDGGLGNTGDEPGVDVKSQRDERHYSHLQDETTVTVVDYSSNPNEDDSNVKIDFPGIRLQEWFESPGAKRSTDDEGKPTGVRWIHIDGLNWEVIKSLTLQYSLHPLAVEDALRAEHSPRSKLDFYKDHLYLQILVQHTHAADEEALHDAAEALADGRVDAVVTNGRNRGHYNQDPEALGDRVRNGIDEVINGNPKKKRGKSDRLLELPEGVEGVFEPTVALTKLQGGHSPFEATSHRLTVDHLSAKYMVPIRRGVLSIFMTRDGTLISLAGKPCQEVLAPIYHRLEDERSLLRRSGDCSMLAEAILDVVVDLSIEVSQAFESEILKVEAAVLVDPEVEIVRHLHILSSQLIRLRRSLTPLLHVCYIVRDQDIQRSLAASALAVAGGGNTGTSPNPHAMRNKHFMSPSMPSTPIYEAPAGGGGMLDPHGALGKGMVAGFGNGMINVNPNLVGQGFFSPMTKVYIGDVIDHLEIIISSLDQFVATCDHLTDYVFNALSFETNASMERLSIVTVVFLPLTFIASYFGMNFIDFNALNQDVAYFWKVATPLTVGFFLIFSFTYLRAAFQTVQRKMGRWRRTKMVEQVIKQRKQQ